VLLDLAADSTVAATYLNGLGIDNHLRQSGAAGMSYFLADHLGSTAGLADPAGDLLEQLAYDSFGGGAGSARTRYAYTGRERDADTGLYHYRARWYDPQAGRFVSEDPIGLVGGVNLNAYVKNNPVNATDPFGLQEGGTWALDDPGRYVPGPQGERPNIWVSVEPGVGVHVTVPGLNGGGGAVMNVNTGEVCTYVKGCIRYGYGVMGSAGNKIGVSIFGPRCGKDIGGLQGASAAELASPGGGFGGSVDYGGGLGASIEGKPSYGLGFSLGFDVCGVQVVGGLQFTA
jgi:RHS repeat-associated protein